MDFTGLPIFQTGLALIIVWALFSMGCSFINETVVQIKSERGKFLYGKLMNLLEDKPNGINWAALIYQHGSFDLLSERVGEPASSVSPNLFARSFMQVLAHSSAVRLTLKEGEDSLWQALQKVPLVYKNSDVMQMVNMYIAEAKTKSSDAEALQHLQEGLERWYTQYEWQMTGWYKLLSKKRLLALGLLVAFICNVDSIEIFKHLSKYPQASGKIISYYQDNSVKLDSLNNALANEGAGGINRLMQDSSYREALKLGLAERENVLPMIEPGWFIRIGEFFKNSTNDNWLTFILAKVLGFLISGIVVSMGAPFWFDALKKLTAKVV